MVAERIRQYIKEKGLSAASFEKEVGAANGTLGKALKTGGSLSGATLENILTKYRDLSAEWLFRGDGNMLRQAKVVTAEAVSAIAGSDELRDLIEEQRRTINEMAMALRKQAEVIAQLLEGRK